MRLRVAVAACLLALAVGTGAASVAQPALVTIRVASQPADDVTPVLYAQHAGLFAKAGLDVQITRMVSGAAVTAAVVGGSVDIGKSSLMPLINAHARGFPLVLIAPGELWLSTAPISGLVALKSSGIRSGRDLDGKTVSTAALKDLLELGTRLWVDQHGGDAQTLHFIELPTSAVPDALADGRIAAANLSNPNLAEVVASGKVRIIGRPDDAIAKRFLITGWFANAAYVAKNRDAIERFARVVRAAAAYTNAHHAETVPLIAPFWGIDADVIAHMERATSGGALDPREIQPMIDAAARYKIIDHAFNASELLAPGV